MQAYGLGSLVGVALPFGRSQESEADRIGLILMAKAGYDPRTAIDFWQRMAGAEQGGRPPEWLSTHPSPETRVADLQKWMPDALAYFKPPGVPIAMLPGVAGAPARDGTARR
jgi:predicted Zn-dependent protease